MMIRRVMHVLCATRSRAAAHEHAYCSGFAQRKCQPAGVVHVQGYSMKTSGLGAQPEQTVCDKVIGKSCGRSGPDQLAYMATDLTIGYGSAGY